MAEATELYDRAIGTFSRGVDAVRDDQWGGPTPCSEWTVRDLVNHMTNEQLWVVPLMAGKTIAEVGDAFDGDVLGADPKQSWKSAADAAAAAFGEPGAMDRTVHLSYGDESAANYFDQILMDTLVHGWDICRATGADERLDPEVVDHVYAFARPQAALFSGSGLFAPEVPVDDQADQQTRLLALLGREA